MCFFFWRSSELRDPFSRKRSWCCALYNYFVADTCFPSRLKHNNASFLVFTNKSGSQKHSKRMKARKVSQTYRLKNGEVFFAEFPRTSKVREDKQLTFLNGLRIRCFQRTCVYEPCEVFNRSSDFQNNFQTNDLSTIALRIRPLVMHTILNPTLFYSYDTQTSEVMCWFFHVI